MKLEHIKEDKCSHCGALTVEESRKNQHVNGLWNEERYFACGKIVRFLPNYGKDFEPQVVKECTNLPTTIEINTKRSKLYEQIVAVVDKSKADEEYKQDLLRRIRFV